MATTTALLIRLRKGTGRILRGCGIAAGLLTFAMMLLVVGNAVSRFAFNAPIDGSLEITEALLSTMIFLSLALTQYEGGHIHVSLLTKHLPAGPQRLLQGIAMALGMLFFAWAAYATWGFALKSFALREQEWGAIQFPLYPIKFIVFAGLLLLAIQFFLDTLAALFNLEKTVDSTRQEQA